MAVEKENEFVNWVGELEKIMARLRDPENGCPWDLEQSHSSLKPYLIEEAYELIDAIDDNDQQRMIDELGDVLLQVIFHCQLGREHDRFDIQEVARRCCRKLIDRHPHVFGDAALESAEAVLTQWEEIKRSETSHRDRQSALDGIPRALPALSQAEKIQKKAARQGFEWPIVDRAVDKLEEEFAELKTSLHDPDQFRDELGDVLFSVVNLARYKGESAEELLRQTIGKFYNRFRYIEQRLEVNGKRLADYTLEEMEEAWREAKHAGAGDEST